MNRQLCMYDTRVPYCLYFRLTAVKIKNKWACICSKVMANISIITCKPPQGKVYSIILNSGIFIISIMSLGIMAIHLNIEPIFIALGQLPNVSKWV